MDTYHAIQKTSLYSFLILWLVESVIAVIWLVLIPADPKNSFLFGFSVDRLLLIIAAVASIAIPTVVLLHPKIRNEIEKRWRLLASNVAGLIIFFFVYTLFLHFLPSIGAWVEEIALQNPAISLRVFPLGLLIFFLVLQIGLLIVPTILAQAVIGIKAALTRTRRTWKAYSKKERTFIGVSIFVGITAAFLILEVGLRLFFPQETYSYLKATVGTQYASSEFLTFTLRANYEGFLPSQERPGEMVDVKVNSMGLRGEEITLDKPVGTKRILVLGDSYTFGVFVANKDTYPAVLQDLLRADGQIIEVINAGYADGWDPDEHYAWLVNRGIQFDPDLIIYGFFIGNDIQQLYPEYWYGLDSRGLPTKVFDDRYFVDETGGLRAVTDTSYAAGTLWLYRVPLLRESHVFVLLAKAINQVIGYFPKHWIEGRHEEASDWLYTETSTPEMLAQEELFKRLVGGMSEVADQRGADFLVVMIPMNYQIIYQGTKLEPTRNYYEEIKPMFDEMGIRYLDIFELMLATPGHYFPDNGEYHNNENGYRFIAEQIKAYLDKEK